MSDSEDSDVTDTNKLNKNDESAEERAKIRTELSTMSFEDLQKLKETMGAKMLNETLFGGAKAKNPKTTFKRVNKNRPMETSSKIRPAKLKICKAPKIKNERLRISDPRFDPLCGTFDKSEFKQNYKFLGNVRKDEKEQLKKDYQKCEDPKRRAQIKLMMQRIDNQIRENDKTEVKQQKMAEERRAIKDKLKRGEKPIFKKKSERKIEDLVNKYEELKKSNKLEKHIEKRSKKMEKKEKKHNLKPTTDNILE